MKRRPSLFPSSEQLKVELQRERNRQRNRQMLGGAAAALVTAAAAAVLIVNLWLPVLRIYGSSMSPALEKGDIVLALRSDRAERGDIVAFYNGGQILVKRVIAEPGDWIDIEEDGTVWVNGQRLDEPYVKEKVLGEADIRLPCQVPEESIFVMGDHRATSVDSRSSAVGFVRWEQLIGRVIFRVWPVTKLGITDR